MHSSMFLSTITLMLFCSLPTHALTGGKAWVDFYRSCPDDIFTTDDLVTFMSSPRHSASVISASASASASPTASAHPSASTLPSSKSLFRTLLAAGKTDTTGIKSTPVNITQGDCKAVPIVVPTHIDSNSVSVEVELLAVSPFQECNITLHEVPACIDKPLLTAPVKNRQAKSGCTERNFGAWTDVWVSLDCEEVGTGRLGPYRNTVPGTRPVRL